MSTIVYPNGSNNTNPLVLTNNTTQLQESSGTATQSGVISESGGSYGLEKTGAGTLILSANNTYSGGTTVSQGTIAISSDANLGNANGALTLNNGTLKFLSAFDLSSTRAVTLQSSGAVNTIDTSGFATTISQVINGSGGLVEAGNNTVTLSGANTFAGGLVVSGGGGGGVVLGSSTAAGTGSITVAGNSLTNLGYADGVNVANAVTLAGSSTQLFVSSGTATQSGIISETGGSRSLVKFGFGTLVLTGNNTYTGGTTISLGTLQVSADENLGDSAGAIRLGNNGILLFGAAFNPNASRAIITTAIPGASGIINTNGFDIAFAQGISGSGGITKTGTGTLTLNAVGTYAGATDVNQGVLRLGVDGALSSSGLGVNGLGTLDLNGHNQTIGTLNGTGNITLGSGTLTVNGATNLDGVISGTGGVVIANTFVVSKANTYTGGTTVTSSGSLQIGVNNTGSIAGDITDNGVVIFNRNDTITFSGAISGTGRIQTNIGRTVLSGANTYSGGTTVNAGFLQLGTGGSLASTGALTVNGGTFDLNNNSQAVGALSGLGGNITLGSGNLTANSALSTSLATVISGSGSLIKNGSGTLTLTGFNSYSGGTTITAGTIQVSADSQLGASTGSLNFNGGTLKLGASFFLNSARAVTLGPSGGTVDTNGFVTALGYPGNLLTGTGGLTKAGVGTLYLSGSANTYSGGTTINAGIVSIDSFTNLGSGNLTFNGGTLDVRLVDVSTGPAITINGAGGTINGDFTETIASPITGVGTLTKTGLGTLILTGSNSYGDTVITGNGVLQIGNGGTTGTLGNGNVVDDALLVFNRSGSYTVNGNISGSGGVTIFGTPTFAGTLSYTGGTFVQAGATIKLAGAALLPTTGVFSLLGTLDISATNAGITLASLSSSTPTTAAIALGSKTLTLSNNNGPFNESIFGGDITGTGGITLAQGSQRFTGVTHYTGSTVIAAGATLRLSNGGSIGFSAVQDNGTFDPQGGSVGSLNGSGILSSGVTITNGAGTFSGDVDVSVTIAGGTQTFSGSGSTFATFTIASGAELALTGSGSFQGDTVAANGVLDISGTNSGASIQYLTGSGTVVLGSKTLTLTNVSGTAFPATFSGNLTGSGGLNFSGFGGPLGVRILTGNNSYSGITTIGSQSTLQVGNGSTSGTLGSGAVTDTGTLTFNRSDTITVANAISGSGGLTQNGSGNLVLSGVDTYTGPTTVRLGTLSVNGSIAASNITVAPVASLNNPTYATLGGTGTVGTTNVGDHGVLAPGNGVGTLRVNGNLTLTSGAIDAEEISPSAADEVMVSGSASIGGTLTENFANGSYGHQTFTLLHADGGISGSFANVAVTGLPAGLNTYVTYDANNVYLMTDHTPVVTTSNVNAQRGQTLSLSGLFTVSDGDGDTITKYQLWDGTTDPTSGYFVVGGVAQAPRTVIEITAAQLAQTSFVTGIVGDSLQIRAFDGALWSAGDNAQWAPFTVTVPANQAPVVTTSNVNTTAGQTLAASSLFTVSDADGDAITKYQLWDGTADPSSGYFVVGGVAQAARTVIDISAAQLSQVSFVTGRAGDSLQIRAYDGTDWSADANAKWSPFTISVFANSPPVVTTSNINAQRGQTLSASSLFTVSDADGDAVTRYQLWDGSTDPASGYFTVGGVVQAARTVIDISAAQLAQVSFVAGSAAPDTLQIRAYDGFSWSAADNAQWSPFTVTVPINHAPVVTTSDIPAQRNQTLAASSLFSVSDADNDPITRYQLWDATTDPASGYFTVGGVVQAARTVIDISAAQLAQVGFVTGRTGDALQIRAFDGTDWSAGDNARWSPFNVTVPPNNPPVVTTSDVAAQHDRTLALSGLFTVSDADNDTITKYQVWDATTTPDSGHFMVGGVAQAPRTVIDISAAQLAQTSFVTGGVGASLQIRAFDGSDWSAADNARWSPFNVTVPPNNPPVVTTMDLATTAGQSLTASSLFTASDADGDAITEYQFWDSTTDPASGHFVVGGAAQAARTVIDLPASQLGQVSFLTGSVGDTIQVRAFDGRSWSAADNAQWSPFHIAVS